MIQRYRIEKVPVMKGNVLLCLPLGEFREHEFMKLSGSLIGTFGPQAQIQMISKNPEKWIVVCENQESSIPRLEMVDSSFQEVEMLPELIEKAEEECNKLNHLIRASIREIEDLAKQKNELEMEIEELHSELNSDRYNRDIRHKYGKQIRKDASRLIDRLLPPSEV